MNFLLPQGIGDSVWCLLKIQAANALLGGGPLHAHLACFDPANDVEHRAVDFISRFSFVASASPYYVPRNGQAGPALRPGASSDTCGYYRYLPDGPTDLPGIDYVMMPNAPLERGISLAYWLPEFAINWKIMDDFHIADEEQQAVAPYIAPNTVLFFCGSQASNSTDGHNRDGLWTPLQWVQLGEWLRAEYSANIVVVGAQYDASYYDECIAPILQTHVAPPWTNLIGKLSIGETFALTQRAACVISYQSGIGIVSHYQGTPVAIFWRKRGRSISSTRFLSFEEAMATAWTNPDMLMQNKHIPMIYDSHDLLHLVHEIRRKKWMTPRPSPRTVTDSQSPA